MPPNTEELIAKIHDARELLMQVCIALNAPAATPQPKRTPTPPMPKQPQYRGDAGRFRRALWECGWFKHAKDMVFHDKRRNWSRIKLWFANSIYEASQMQQEALEAELRKEFGDRIIKMGFIKHWTDDKSFCIWLRN